MPLAVDPETGKRLLCGDLHLVLGSWLTDSTGYIPQISLAVIGIVAYGILGAIYWFRLWRSGQKWMLVLCISTMTMIAGFIVRFPMRSSPDSIPIYSVSTLLVLLSPCAFLAQDYMILPRLATWLDAEDCLFLKSRRVVRIFVWSDVVTFLLQMSGSGMTAVQSNIANIGHYIVIVGLVIQLCSFSLFVILSLTFGYRVRSRHPEKWTRQVISRNSSHMTTTIHLGFWEDWRVLYFALCYTAIGIIVRSVFRIIEFAQGYDGTLRTVEWYFWAFDALPLLLAIGVYCFVWPPCFLREETRYFADSPASGYSMQRLPTGSPTSVTPFSGNRSDEYKV